MKKTLITFLILALSVVTGCSENTNNPETVFADKDILFGMTLDQVSESVNLDLLESEVEDADSHFIHYSTDYSILFDQYVDINLQFSNYETGDFDQVLIGYYAEFDQKTNVEKLTTSISKVYGEPNKIVQETMTVYTWDYGSIDQLSQTQLVDMKNLLSSGYPDITAIQQSYIDSYFEAIEEQSLSLLQISLFVPNVQSLESPMYIRAEGQYFALDLLTRQ